MSAVTIIAMSKEDDEKIDNGIKSVMWIEWWTFLKILDIKFKTLDMLSKHSTTEI